MSTAVHARRGHSRRSFWRHVRRFVPSVAAASRNRLMMLPLNTLDFLASRPFRELRALPANHLRLRIGTDQRIVFGHVDHITRSYGFWLQMAAARLVQPGSTVLDIGCGCGRTAQVLRDAYWRNRPFFAGTYIGVDVDGEAIAWCTDHFPSDRFRFHRLDMFSSVYNPTGATQQPDLPVDPASVDLVLCLSLFTHLLEPDVNYYLRQISTRSSARRCGIRYVLLHRPPARQPRRPVHVPAPQRPGVDRIPGVSRSGSRLRGGVPSRHDERGRLRRDHDRAGRAGDRSDPDQHHHAPVRAAESFVGMIPGLCMPHTPTVSHGLLRRHAPLAPDRPVSHLRGI